MQDETNSKATNEQVKEVLEGIHAKSFGNGLIEITKGIDRCVRKVHSLPEHVRVNE